MFEPRFRVDDRVRIRDDFLVDGGVYDFVDDMKIFLGYETTVKKVLTRPGKDAAYQLDIDEGYWVWYEDMLEPVNREEEEAHAFFDARALNGHTADTSPIEFNEPIETEIETKPESLEAFIDLFALSKEDFI